jgi:hypothetical protein
MFYGLFLGGNSMEREKLNSNWMNRLLDKCEEEGVSKKVSERFIDFYVSERRNQDAKFTEASKRTQRATN